MILHLGSDLVVCEKDVIMIMDSSCANAKSTKEYIDRAEKAESSVPEGEQPKSYVIVADGDSSRVHASPISSQTLWKRCEDAGK